MAAKLQVTRKVSKAEVTELTRAWNSLPRGHKTLVSQKSAVHMNTIYNYLRGNAAEVGGIRSFRKALGLPSEFVDGSNT